MTLAVYGAGAFGTALAVVLARSGRPVRLIARNPDAAIAIGEGLEHPRLPGVGLPDTIERDSGPAAVAGASTVLIGVPTQHLRSALGDIAGHLPPTANLVLLCKGIEQATGDLVHDVAAEVLPGHPCALLSGPGFAGEIARGLPTAMALAAPDMADAQRLAADLSTDTFRLYATDDVPGVALGGALKNVLAIACGIVEGRRLGESARAALIARGLAEMSRFALAQGARAETLTGLSGLGDLVLTATSRQSRNLRFGIALGEGRTADQLLASGEALAEGAWTAGIAARLAREAGIDMPVTQAVAAVIGGQVTVDDVIAGLLARPLKREAG